MKSFAELWRDAPYRQGSYPMKNAGRMVVEDGLEQETCEMKKRTAHGEMCEAVVSENP